MFQLTLAIFFVASAAALSNNVCPSFGDYATTFLNKKCFFNPDVQDSLSNIALRHGFKLEAFNVKTEDRYIIKVYKITSHSTNNTGPPIILFHGIGRNARCFFLKGKESLPFALVNKGYVAFVVSARGGEDTSHEYLKKSNPKFWSFSFHEWGVYDARAVIKFVAEETGKTGEITYLGHSMGTAAIFAYASIYPEEADTYLKRIVALAPVVNVWKVKAPLLPELSDINEELKSLLDELKIYKFNLDILKLCPLYPNNKLCYIVAILLSGKSTQNNYPEVFPMLFSEGNEPISVNSLIHYFQIAKNKGEFRKFDFGNSTNLEIYGTPIPPKYPLENIITQVRLLHTNDDALGPPEDVEVLFNILETDKRKILIGTENFLVNHIDFLVHENVEEVIYKPLFEILDD